MAEHEREPDTRGSEETTEENERTMPTPGGLRGLV